MKQITIDNNTKQELIQKFTQYIDTVKLSDDRINFTSAITPNAQNVIKPTVYITAEAYLKMMLYVRDTSTEIAWHGTVKRFKTDTEHYYIINDVFLYPQKLSAATVQTDQEKYNKWLEDLDDDTYNNLRFQGHSHVNFAASPSGVDLQYYNDILQVLPSSDYYIFMILNKSGDFTLMIYDLASNTIFEKNDITAQIIHSNGENLTAEIIEQKKQYCETPVTTINKYTPTQYNAYNAYNKYMATRDLPPATQYEDETETDLLFQSIDAKHRFKNVRLKK